MRIKLDDSWLILLIVGVWGIWMYQHHLRPCFWRTVVVIGLIGLFIYKTRKRYPYLIVLYVYLNLEGGGVTIYNDLKYGLSEILYLPTTEMREYKFKFYVFTTQSATERLEALSKWYEGEILSSDKINYGSRGTYTLSLWTNISEHKIKEDYILVLEDDATPMFSLINYKTHLNIIAKYNWDIVFLDHRTYLMYHVGLGYLGACATMVKASSYTKVTRCLNANRHYSRLNLDWNLNFCCQTIPGIRCETYPLFRENGIKPATIKKRPELLESDIVLGG
jgi:hypothetical protein